MEGGTLTPIRRKRGHYINNRQRNFRAENEARQEECLTMTKESVGPSAGGNSAVYDAADRA